MIKKGLTYTAIILLALLLLGITGVLAVFHGPFTGLKELYVTTAMTTLSHQYLARIFVGDEEINAIMEKNRIKGEIPNSKIEDIQVFASLQTVEDSPTPDLESELKQLKFHNRQETEKRREELKKMELKEIKGTGYSGYLLIVNDPSRVRMASTDKLGQIGVKLKDMVVKQNAAAGINAGGFDDPGGEGFGGIPTECIIEKSQIIYGEENKEYDIIGFNKNHVLVLGRYTLKQALELGIRDAVAFSPFLIVNGNPVIKEGNGGWGVGPRTAIGQTKDGKVLLLVIDGRQLHSIGATLKDIQDILLENGAYNAANLDGGSSTVMYYNGSLVNKPCSPYGERFLPSAFIVDKTPE